MLLKISYKRVKLILQRGYLLLQKAFLGTEFLPKALLNGVSLLLASFIALAAKAADRKLLAFLDMLPQIPDQKQLAAASAFPEHI